MRKVICFEHRTSNSPRAHFNRTGDWRPRLIVWPEYDGQSKDEYEQQNAGDVDDHTDAAWGRIVAGALTKFERSHSLATFAFELVWPSLWERMTSKYALPRYQKKERFDLTEDYVNLRQHWGHENIIFLMAPPIQEKILGNEAKAHGHLCEQATTPFLSHWVVANHKDLGDNWRLF